MKKPLAAVLKEFRFIFLKNRGICPGSKGQQRINSTRSSGKIAARDGVNGLTTMSRLQPAGVFGRLFSSIFPKKLELQVRSEELSDGRIALHPVYLLAGQEVDPALVSLDPRQRILGHCVVADQSVLSARRQGSAKLPKPTAAKYLHDLKRKGVSVRAKTSGAPTDVREANPRVRLTLNSGDTLDVHCQLMTDQGVAVAKPLDLEQVRHDEGWYVAEGDLLHVTLTNSDWDEILFTGEATNRLTDVSVPEFLQGARHVRWHTWPCREE